MAARTRRLLVARPIPGIQWIATDEAGRCVAEVHIYDEGEEEFSVLAGYQEGPEVVLRSRTFRLHPNEAVNNIGLLAKAIERLGMENG